MLVLELNQDQRSFIEKTQGVGTVNGIQKVFTEETRHETVPEEYAQDFIEQTRDQDEGEAETFASKKRSYRCGNCLMSGHRAPQCPNPRKDTKEKRRYRCSKCGPEGHKATNCSRDLNQ
ncbi:hypothetical protein P9112_004293 [Eukaryota sp. TZLM1-RC]